MPLPDKESLRFLEAILSTPSPSGFEERVQKVIREHMAPFADNTHRDVHGNQWFVLNPKAPLRVMLSGHVDEIGLMVRYIDDQGFLWVTRIGGPDAVQLWGTRVHVHTAKGPVLGLIGKRPIHTTPPEDRNKGAKLDDLFVDIGAKNKADALKRVAIADPITLTDNFQLLTSKLAVARGMDDRIGAFVVMEALKKIAREQRKPKGRKCPVAVYAVGSVQEEVGLRGATTSAYAIEPHVGIAVDVGFATDYPSENKKIAGDINLGAGPVLHRGPNINRPLGALMEATAKKNRIPIQISGSGGVTGTDAGAIQVSRRGVAAALISIPNRYMHSPVEVVSLEDVEAAANLLARLLMTLKPTQSFVPQ